MTKQSISALAFEGAVAAFCLAAAIYTGAAIFYVVSAIGACCFSFIAGGEFSRSLWRPLAMELLDDLRRLR
jgi:hypothetical protein